MTVTTDLTTKTTQAPDGSRRITWWNGSEWVVYGTDERGLFAQHGDTKRRWNGNSFVGRHA